MTPTNLIYFSSEASGKKNNLTIFCGSGNRELSKEIAGHLDVQLGRISVFKNADSETEVEVLDSVRGQRVFVI